MPTSRLTTMPFDIQACIWKSYFTNIVLKQFNTKSVLYEVRLYTDFGKPVNERWELNWHSFIPFQSAISGQRRIHVEYDGWEAEYEYEREEFEEYLTRGTLRVPYEAYLDWEHWNM